MKYNINLVADLRKQERREQRKSEFVTYAFVALAGGLSLVIFKCVIFLLIINRDLNTAENRLQSLQAEYLRYKQTSMSIDKEDLELLDQLQHKRIFWTKKLTSMALPLPNNYWVNSFTFKKGILNVRGFGYLENQQRQLITLDDYLNILRADPVFNKGMQRIALIETRRDDVASEHNQARVSFEFTAQAPKPLLRK